MKTIYVVMGQTGEYSDRSEWPVMAYTDKPSAEKHADDAMMEARRLKADQEYGAKNKYDPNMSMDYTGTDYYVMDVPMTQEPYTPRALLRDTCAVPDRPETEGLEPDGEAAYCPEHR